MVVNTSSLASASVPKLEHVTLGPESGLLEAQLP
ncbi:hypothetical protein ABIB51_003974 [Arthrobacter sp. UYCu712]